MTRTVITIWMMWHVVITIDVAMGDGIQVVILGDVVVIGLLCFVKGGDVVVGKWCGDGQVLVTGRWSSLLLGLWQPCPVQVFRGQEGEGNGWGNSPGDHGYW